jgi:hypothetical protein
MSFLFIYYEHYHQPTNPQNMNFNIADRGVHKCYKVAHGDLGIWVKANIDEAFVSKKPLRLVFDDSTDHYERAAKVARTHIQAKGYYKVYEYWYDGCNFSDEDYIKGRPIQEGRRGGSCWSSEVWKFHDTEIPDEQEVMCGGVVEASAATAAAAAPEPDVCVVCMEGHPETLVIPCGHSVACRACSDQLAVGINAHRCILCRTEIETILVDGE